MLRTFGRRACIETEAVAPSLNTDRVHAQNHALAAVSTQRARYADDGYFDDAHARANAAFWPGVEP